MKLLKYVAFLLGGLITLVALAALIVALSFDAARAKAELAEFVQERTQRTLRIPGEIELSFWPMPGLRLGTVQLSERGREDSFVEVAGGHMALALLPLLHFQFVVDRIELEGLTIKLERGTDDRFNFEDLLVAHGAKGTSALKFEVAAIFVARSKLNYRDAIRNTSYAITGLECVAEPLAGTASGKFSGKGRIVSESTALDGAISFASGYTLPSAGGGIALGELALSMDGKAGDLTRLSATLLAAALEYRGQAAALDASALEVKVRARRPAGELSIHLAVPTLSAEGHKLAAGTATANLQATDAAAEYSASLTLSRLTRMADAIRVGAVASELVVRAGASSLTGRFNSSLRANLARKLIVVPDAVGDLVVQHPRLANPGIVLPLSADFLADFAGERFNANIAAKFDGAPLRAQLRTTRFQPVVLAFDLAAERLDIDRHLVAGPEHANTEDTGGQLDLPGIADLDLKGSLKIGYLRYAGFKANELRMGLRGTKRTLTLAPMAARIYGGRVAGTATYSAPGNRFRLQQSLTDIAVHSLIMDLSGHDLLQGRGNISFDLETSGDSVATLKKQLAGGVRLALRNGAIKGIDLERVIADAKQRRFAASNVHWADAGASTRFSELTATFRLAGGVAHNDDLAAKSPSLRVTGTGDIDIGEGRLDYLVRTSAAAGVAGPGGKELADLRGISVPVRVAGAFDRIGYGLAVADPRDPPTKETRGERLAATQRKRPELTADRPQHDRVGGPHK